MWIPCVTTDKSLPLSALGEGYMSSGMRKDFAFLEEQRKKQAADSGVSPSWSRLSLAFPTSSQPSWALSSLPKSPKLPCVVFPH